MTAPALPRGRNESRTRLYKLGEWEHPIYDSATSDMHPDDYLLYGPHTELGAVIDIPGMPGQPGTQFRWSGVWTQKSRRKIERHQLSEYLKYLTTWANPFLPPLIGAYTDPAHCIHPQHTSPYGCPSCSIYRSRMTPVAEIARNTLFDANLTCQITQPKDRYR